MSVREINVYGIADMTGALQGAQDGDIFNFYIRNDMYFSGAVMFSRAIVVNLINANGSRVILTTLGAYRHFTTGTAGSVTGLTVIIGPNIALDGMGTGGGVLIYGNNCSLTLDSCMITNCMNSGNGGGVLIQGNLSRSRLIMNDAHIDRCRAGSGGGVFGAGCDMQMNGGQIVDNTATNSGGGITTIAGGNRLGSTLVIVGAKVSGNSAAASYASGGGINAFDTIATIRCSEISYNLADDYGGGIYSFAQLLGSDHNHLTMINSQVIGNMTRNTGGGIGLQGKFGKFEIENCRIARNQASSAISGTNQGGGIYFAGASTLRLEDGQVTQNMAGKGGGGIFVNNATLILAGTAEVSGNESGIIGGGIYGYYLSSVTIEGTARVVGNSANSGGDAERAYGGGGAVALYASDLVVSADALIGGNVALSYGGAIWTYPDFTPISAVAIEGGAVVENSANYGGAISMGAVLGHTPTLTITGGEIIGNSAAKDGGGIITQGSPVSIAGCEITGNSAGRDGGGIFTDRLENVTVYASCAFGENSARNYAYWALTDGGDSDIHRAHIFTDRFSTFIPDQTPPPAVWSFLNAYNNYDIHYVKPPKTITVYCVDADNHTYVIHSTSINSFIGATVAIPPRDVIVDTDRNIWALEPPDQSAQTVELTDPQADYVVIFYYSMPVDYVIVTERYVDTCGNEIRRPTQTVARFGGDYIKAAPVIAGYAFAGYRVDQGPLNTGTVSIIGIIADTTVTFVYRRNRKPRHRCKCCCRKRNPCYCLYRREYQTKPETHP